MVQPSRQPCAPHRSRCLTRTAAATVAGYFVEAIRHPMIRWGSHHVGHGFIVDLRAAADKGNPTDALPRGSSVASP
jgi:hypothetical protein